MSLVGNSGSNDICLTHLRGEAFVELDLLLRVEYTRRKSIYFPKSNIM